MDLESMDLNHSSDKNDDVVDDNLFEEVILVDYGVSESDDSKSSENENQNEVVKSSKAKKKQFDQLDAFMKEHSESSIGKDKFNKLWRNLTQKLNALGPPSFTDSEWKMKWSQHKYNKKRKRSTNITEIPGPSCQDKPSHEFQSLDPVVDKVASVIHETVHSHSEIADKLVVVIEKEDAILEKLDTGNNLLREIAKSLAKRI